MNDEKLIELVRKHEEIYDLSHSKYMDVNFKERVWRDIGKEMNTDGK